MVAGVHYLSTSGARAAAVLAVDADPSRPGGMTTIYRHLAADEQRARQVIADVLAVPKNS